MSPHERKFERLLADVYTNAHRCATHTYTFLSLRHFAERQPCLNAALKRHAAFWNDTSHAHLASAFIAMGRLFDTDSNANSLVKLLRFAQGHLSIFSDASRIARGQTSVPPAATPVGIVKMALPQKSTLSEIWEIASDAGKLYREKVAPIRNKVYAHTHDLTPDEVESLFVGLSLDKFAYLALVPLQVHLALHDWYFDGSAPVPRSVQGSVSVLAGSGLPPSEDDWVHVHVIAQVENLLLELQAEES